MKVDRLISIIMVLLNKERVSAQELANMFEVSKRTIYRDIDAINMAGIPICSTSGVGGGIEIMPNYKIQNTIFSSNDLSTIIMGLSNLSSIMHGSELANSLAKIKSFLPADRAKDIELKANQLSVDLSRWIGNGNTKPYLEIIQTALRKYTLVSFQYVDQYGNQTTRTVEPYQLVLKSNYWYFWGYCHSKNDYRLFRLSRISNLKALPESFTPRDYPKPILDFEEIQKTLQIEITLRIHKSIMDRVLDYCSYEQFSPDGNDYYMVTFPFIENAYYYDILLSFGNKCECIKPAHIRAGLVQRIKDIAAVYTE